MWVVKTKQQTNTMTTLPPAPHVYAQTVHWEVRKAFNANDPDERYKVTTTTWSDGRTTTSVETR